MDFEKYIAETGVTVVEGSLPNGWWGAYDWRSHTIRLRPRLGVVQYGTTLGHELGHALYRHQGTTPRQERQADVWAARRLIRASDFIDALRVSESPVGVAQILGVMPANIHTYISTLSPNEVVLIRKLIQREEAC
ncbi:ImmA/IrrE family metallo-endopeptidase [Arthrobacter sp. CP30]